MQSKQRETKGKETKDVKQQQQKIKVRPQKQNQNQFDSKFEMNIKEERSIKPQPKKEMILQQKKESRQHQKVGYDVSCLQKKDSMVMLQHYDEIIQQIINGQCQQISFQKTYDLVFKLCKLHKQKQILSIMEQKIIEFMRRKYSQISKDQVVEELLRVIQETCLVTEKMIQVCLYLDTVYCQKQLKITLRKYLDKIIFKSLIGEVSVLKIMAKALFQSRIFLKRQITTQLVNKFFEMDQKNIFFQKHLIPFYTQLLQKSYHSLAQHQWTTNTVDDYLKWARKQLQNEKTFIQQNLIQKKGQQGLETVIAAIYKTIVIEFKQRIYQQPEQLIFEKLNFPILQLFAFGKKKDVQMHIQWFLVVLQTKLNALVVTENVGFLISFCQLYNNVLEYLRFTHGKFEINYRVVFTFEEWINNQKFNISLRLNLLIDEYMKGNHQIKIDQFIKKVIIVFKLIKEKNLFENLYRKMLISRLSQCYLTYELENQLKIVHAMEKECGQDWSKKIINVNNQFGSNRQKYLQYKGEISIKPEMNWNIGGLLPVIVEENDWPFEFKKTSIVLDKQLMKFAPSFEQIFHLPINNYKLTWSPFTGSATLKVTLGKNSRMILVTTEVANLLLYLVKGPSLLAHYLCQTGYKMDQIEHSVQTIISSGIVNSIPKNHDMLLSLADQIQSGEQLLDLINFKTNLQMQVRAMEELKADRKLMVEAIVVKIMKKLRVTTREVLFEESASSLEQKGFKFNKDFVEKSIDRLVEKEFLRQFPEQNKLGYIA